MERTDPFYSESNLAFLRKGIEALNAGAGVEHELIDPFDSEENISRLKQSIEQLEAGKIVKKTIEELEAMAGDSREN